MEAFSTHQGLVAPLDRVNVDTDAIIPKQFLKRIERSGFGKYVFFEWRFDFNGNKIEEFVLNKPEYDGVSILLTRANFGCGSSREHAPWAIADYGFKVIIAPSFADIFYNNCFKNGILAIKLTEEEVDSLFKRAESIEKYNLSIDLDNMQIKDNEGLTIQFELDDFRKEYIIKGLDDIGLILKYEEKIREYELLNIKS